MTEIHPLPTIVPPTGVCPVCGGTVRAVVMGWGEDELIWACDRDDYHWWNADGSP
jgi:hypothetical protein